jgi:hypothetical protein
MLALLKPQVPYKLGSICFGKWEMRARIYSRMMSEG